MVVVRLPPPTGGISPQYITLNSGDELIRIFDPTQYGATAISFRNYGSISRFDHHREYPNKIDPDRSVIYAGQTLSCCLVEVFGDGDVIELKQQKVAFLTLTASIKLLDLRGSGAMGAGTVAAISAITQRDISQAWGKYFYENFQLYGLIDGLMFSGAHNSEDVIFLYERAKAKIESAKVQVLNLNHPDFLERILETAEIHGLVVR
jgi:hypothetical protein